MARKFKVVFKANGTEARCYLHFDGAVEHEEMPQQEQLEKSHRRIELISRLRQYMETCGDGNLDSIKIERVDK